MSIPLVAICPSAKCNPCLICWFIIIDIWTKQSHICRWYILNFQLKTLVLKTQCRRTYLLSTFWNTNLPHSTNWFRKALIKKTYLAKVVRNAQKPRVGPLSRPCRPFLGPLVAILDFWSSNRRNERIKKLTSGFNNLSFDLFPDPVGHFG